MYDITDPTAQAFLVNIDGTTNAAQEYGKLVNESLATENDGSKLAAQFYNDLYYALISVVHEYGNVTGNAQDTTDPIDTQNFLNSLRAMMETSDNPFSRYALFQERVFASVDSTVTGWITRELNTTAVNSISGALLSGNQIILPGGEYRVSGFGSYRDVGTVTSYAKLGLYNVTEGNYLFGGNSLFGSGSSAVDNSAEKTVLTGEFTLSDTTTVELRQFITEGGNSQGLGSHVDGGVGDYTTVSQLEVWKLG